MQLDLSQVFWRHPLPVILDLNEYLFSFATDPDECGPASRMTMDVGQSFLHQTEYDKFHVGSKPFKIAGNIERDIQPASLLYPLHVPAQRRCQSALIEQRGVQQIRGGANLLGQVLDQILNILDAVGELRRIVLCFFAKHCELQAQGSQALAGTVMQFPCDTSSFLILNSQQPS